MKQLKNLEEDVLPWNWNQFRFLPLNQNLITAWEKGFWSQSQKMTSDHRVTYSERDVK